MDRVLVIMIDAQKYNRLTGTLYVLVFMLLCPITTHAQGSPDVPDIIRVTHDHIQDGVLIQWESSTDDSIMFYHLYKRNADDSGTRIFSFSSNTFEYLHTTGGLKNWTYSVTAEDSATNESLIKPNWQKTASVSVEFDPCIPSNEVSWTAYEGWDGNISGYNIYRIDPENSQEILGFVLPGNPLTFQDTDISIGSVYNYFIETMNTSGLSSYSAKDSVESLYPNAPDFITVDYVTVLDQSTIELQFTADVEGPVNDFRIMKRSNTGTPFTEIASISDASLSTQIVLDQFPTSISTYEYKVQSTHQPPGCTEPLVISESNTGTSTLLNYSIDGQFVTLNWNPYKNYPNGIAGYTVQRKSGSGEFFDIQTVGPGTSSWSESIQSVINGFQPGELQYRILAVENTAGPGSPGISISNIVSVQVETHLKIPNAFTPGSNDMNFEFKPIIDFAPKDYLMIVVDRGGRKLFETTDPGHGWDGSFRSGKFVNEGVYVYYIQYTDYTGISRSFTGNVTVLFP